ncbi:hypothetical protein [Microbacterium capsulatum]|uniref:Uncharacterized protein n=1 Tax=Microbacterium capsulatum TaxID=3041921 RepID=A0ABU0XBE6_9MICO|nr:hypothetical protein [Microbacterium sp. ASV81]MDQ4212421.1 hypothetical protein [Microbacterium sp. ASV81]
MTESRAALGGRAEIRRPARPVLAAAAIGALLAAPLLLPAAPAHADDYPSWQDVQNAQGNEQATQDEIGKVSTALASTQKQAAEASTAALKAGEASATARTQADDASRRADALTAQADTAQQAVQQAHEQVGSIAAGRERTDTTAPLAVRLFTSAHPDELLTRLGVMQQLDSTWSELGARAIEQQGVATSLQAQAQAARKARDDLAAAADRAAKKAQEAADAEAAAVADLQGHVTTLYAQLATLKNTTADVVRRYQIGQAVAEQARAQAAAAAAAAAQQGSGGYDLSGYGVNVDPAGAQAYARGQLGNYGWSDGQFGCLLNLWNQESGWRADALNPDSDAYGIPQSLPADKMAAAGPDWRTNGDTQIDWGLSYIQNRYGSPCGAWSHEMAFNWY